MKKILLYSMVFLFLGTSTHAQNMDTIVIGQGTSDQYNPLPGFFGFNREALLYKADEIGASGLISSIAFDISLPNSVIENRSIKIYLMQTDMNQLSC